MRNISLQILFLFSIGGFSGLKAEKKHFLQGGLDLGVGGYTTAAYSGDLNKPAATIRSIGFALKAEALYSYQIWAVENAFALALPQGGEAQSSGTLRNPETLQSTSFNRTIKQSSGVFIENELRLGFRLLQRKNDMGFLFVFAGPVFYKAPELQDQASFSSGATLNATLSQAGIGYTFGFRDISTWDVGKLSVIHIASLRIGWAPYSGVDAQINGGSAEGFTYSTRGGLSLQYEIAAGVAWEDLGWAALLGYESASYLSIDNNDTGSGIVLGRFYLKGVKQLWL